MRTILFSAVLSLLFVSGLFAQPEMMKTPEEGTPLFLLEVTNFASPDSGKSRALINVKIQFDKLQFLRISDTLYQAEVELNFIAYDSDNDQIEGKSFRKKVTVQNYRQTNSDKLFLEIQTRFDLPPADYSIVCEVTDLDSKKSAKAKQKIKLRDYSKPELAISDVRLIDPTDLSQKELERLKEIFAKQLSKFSGYLIATYEVYSPHSTPQLKQEVKLINFRNRVVQKSKFKTENMGFGTVVHVPIFKQNLSVGVQNLKIKIDDGIDKINVGRKIRTNNMNLPITIENLDLAIEQMRYIADKSAIKHIKNAPPGKKKLYFDAYWKKNDPTPNTDTNELMNEYYRRIAFSNAHFSGFRDGWKTDMGMIFILFGSPDDVEREPYNATINPYSSTEIYAWELWYYYDFNRRFVFVDERGFGEYRLLNPNDIYINR